MAVGAALLFMTVVTVATAQIDLGITGNIILAMIIATFKGSLVAMIFMHLWWDNKLYMYLFIMSLVFLAVFIIFTLFDTKHRGRIYAERDGFVQPTAALYSNPDVKWVTYDGHGHDDHGEEGHEGHDHGDEGHGEEAKPVTAGDWQGAHDDEGTPGAEPPAGAAAVAGPPPIEGDAAAGAVKYAMCAACHLPNGVGNPAMKSPQLVGAQDWYLKSSLQKYKAGLRGSAPGDAFGMQMKAMASTLTEDDMNNLVAHIKTLDVVPPTHSLEGDAEAGKAKYVTCVACHGAEGAGNPQMKAPSLTHLPDWYVVEQLKKFKAGHRGADAAKDPEGGAMRPMAMMLSDEDMVNVAAYIKTLKKAE
jgi:cytochrome c oxidase subunit 2